MPGQRHRWRGGHTGRGTWFLGPVLLFLLHRGPAHGYTLTEQLEEFGMEGLHPSVIYRALRDMDEEGWVTSGWNADETQGPPRRIYSLTALGDEMLKAHMQELKQTHDRIDGLMDAYNRHMEKVGDEHH